MYYFKVRKFIRNLVILFLPFVVYINKQRNKEKTDNVLAEN